MRCRVTVFWPKKNYFWGSYNNFQARFAPEKLNIDDLSIILNTDIHTRFPCEVWIQEIGLSIITIASGEARPQEIAFSNEKSNRWLAIDFRTTHQRHCQIEITNSLKLKQKKQHCMWYLGLEYNRRCEPLQKSEIQINFSRKSYHFQI